MANAFQYIANVGKSIGYSAIDTFKEMNPSLSEFAEQNAELGKVLYESVKDFKGTVRKAKDFVIQSQVGEFAIEYKKALFEDLKTGKFYNRERIDAMEARAAGSLFDDNDDPFAEIDGDWDNFDDSWDDQWENFDEDKFLADSMDLTGSKVTQGVAMATARSAEYVVAANKQGLAKMQAHNEFLVNKLNTGLSAINANMASALKFNEEVMNVHVQNSQKFFTNTSAQLETQTQLLQKILDNQIKANGFIEQQEKERERLNYEDITMGGMPDLKQYFKAIGKNASAATGGLGDMLSIFGEGSNTLLAFAGSPLKVLTDGLVKKVIPKMVKDASKSLNDTISGLFSTHLLNMERLADDDDTPEGLRMLAQILGMNTKPKLKADPSKYNKGPIPWDGESKMALTQVIPQLLSKILAAQTGTSERLFNYESGVWEDAHKLMESMKEDNIIKADSAKAFSELSSEINKMMKNIRFKDANEEKEIKKQLDLLYQGLYRSGGMTTYMKAARDKDGFGLSQLASSFGMDSSKLTRVIDPIVREVIERDKSLAFRLGNAQQDTRAGRRRQMDSIQKNSSSSLMAAAYRNFDAGEFVNLDRDGNIIYDPRAVFDKAKDKKNIKMSANNSLLFLKDNKGKTVFDYLDKIRWNLEDIRVNGVYTYGVGGGKPSKSRDRRSISRTNYRVDDFESSDSYNVTSRAEREKQVQYKHRDNDSYNERWDEEEKKFKENKKMTPDYLIKAIYEEAETDEEAAKLLKGALEGDRVHKKNYTRWDEHKSKRKSFLGSLFESADGDPTLFSKFLTKSNELMTAPAEFVANTIKRVDNRLFEIMFGEKEGLDTKSFIGQMLNRLTVTFNNFGEFLKEHILDPLRGETGRRALGNAKEKAKQALAKMGITKESARDFLIGKFDRYEEDVKDEQGNIIHRKGSIKLDQNGRRITLKKGMLSDGADFIGDVKDSVIGGLDTFAAATAGIDEKLYKFNAARNRKLQWYKENNTDRHAVGEGLRSLFREQFPEDFDEKGNPKKGSNYSKYASSINKDFRKDLRQQKYINGELAQNIRRAAMKLHPDFFDESGNIINKKGYNEFAVKYTNRPNIQASIANRFNGGFIDKTGIVAVSEGEIIIPAEYNPFYRKKVAKGTQRYNENKAKSRFVNYINPNNIRGYADGTGPEGVNLDGTAEVSDMRDKIMRSGKIGQLGKEAKSRRGFSDVLGEFFNFIGDEWGDLKARGKKAMGKAVDNLEDVADQMKPKEDDAQNLWNSMTSDLKTNWQNYVAPALGGGLAGAGVSMLTGLVGGPLLGAAVGAGLSLTKNSEAVQNWLFGEVDEKTGERKGNIIKADLANNITKYFPDMAKGGTIGAMMTLLPGGIGPVAGLVLGSAVGFAKNNDKFQDWLFGKMGEDGIRRDGKISPEMLKQLKGAVPAGVLGAIGGLGTSLVFGGPFGLMGNILAGSALGFASQTTQFQEWLFGKYDSETGKKEGGALNAIKDGFVDPVIDFGKNLGTRFFDWLREDVANPIKEAFNPLAKQMEIAGKKLFGTAGNLVKGLLGIEDSNMPWSRRIGNVVRGAGKFAGGTIGLMARPVGSIVSSPFRAVGAVGDFFRRRQLYSGNADYMTAAERNIMRQEIDTGAKFKRYRKDEKDEAGNIIHHKGEVMMDEFGNPVLNGRKSLIRHSRRKDNFEQYDEFLQNASLDELEHVQNALDFTKNPNKQTDKMRANANKNIKKSLEGVDYVTSNKILSMLKKGNVKEALDFIQTSKHLDTKTIERLTRTISSNYADINTAEGLASSGKAGRDTIYKKLGKLGLTNINDKNLGTYENLINKEIERRKNGKSDVENLDDHQEKRHEKIVSLFEDLILSVRAINDPEAQKELRNREFEKLNNYGSTQKSWLRGLDRGDNGIFGGSDLRWESEVDANGHLVSVAYAEDGTRYVQDPVTGALVNETTNDYITHYSRENGRTGEVNAARAFTGKVGRFGNALKNGALDIADRAWNGKYAKDRTGISGKIHEKSESWYKNRCINKGLLTRDEANSYGGSFKDLYDQYLRGEYEGTRWHAFGKEVKSRKKAEKLAAKGYQVTEENVKYTTDDDGNLIKKVKNKDGEWVTDESDAETKSALTKRTNTRKKFFDVMDGLAGIKDSIVSKLDEKLRIDKERDGWLKKAGKVLLGVGGILTAAGFANMFEDEVVPKISNFWDEKIFPKIEQYMEPIKPTIARAAAGIDTAIRSIPSAVDNLGNRIEGFFKVTLPDVFRNKIIPFYQGGYEWLTEKFGLIVETAVPYLLKGAISGIKGVLKGTWQFMKNDIFTIFGGYGRRDAKSIMKNTTGVASSAPSSTFSDSRLGQKMGSFTGFSDFAQKHLGVSATTSTSSSNSAAANVTTEEMENYYIGGTDSYPPVITYSNNTPTTGTSAGSTRATKSSGAAASLFSGDPSGFEGYGEQVGISGEALALPQSVVDDYNETVAPSTSSATIKPSFNTFGNLTQKMLQNNGHDVSTVTTADGQTYIVDNTTGAVYDNNGLETNMAYDEETESLTEGGTNGIFDGFAKRSIGETVLKASVRNFVNGRTSKFAQKLATVGRGSRSKLVRLVSTPFNIIGGSINGAGKVGQALRNYANVPTSGVFRNLDYITSRGARNAIGADNLYQGLVDARVNTFAKDFAGRNSLDLLDSTRNSADDIAELLASKKNILGRSKYSVSDGAIAAAKRNLTDDALTKAAESYIDDAAEAAMHNADGAITSWVGKIKAAFESFTTNSKVKKMAKTVLKEAGAESSDEAVEAFLKKIGKEGTEALIRCSDNFAIRGLKAIGRIMPFVSVVFDVWDFVSGMTNAASIFGVTEDNFEDNFPSWARFACGIANWLNNKVTFGLMPLESMVDLFLKYIAPLLNVDTTEIAELREASSKSLEKFNEQTGLNFTMKEYNNKNKALTKAKYKVKSWFGDDTYNKLYETEYDLMSSTAADKIYSNNLINVHSKKYRAVDRAAGNSGIGSRFLKSAEAGMISQLDPLYAYLRFNTANDTSKQTIADSGCGPASAAMVVNEILGNNALTLPEAVDFALRNGTKVKNEGVSVKYFADIFRDNGLSTTYADTVPTIKTMLKSSNAPIILLGKDADNRSKTRSPFGPNNHYVVANGLSNDGRYIYISDPEQSKANVAYKADILNDATIAIGALTGSSGAKAIPDKYLGYAAAGSGAKRTPFTGIGLRINKALSNKSAMGSGLPKFKISAKGSGISRKVNLRHFSGGDSQIVVPEGRSLFPINEFITSVIVYEQSANIASMDLNYNNTGEVAIGILKWTGSERNELLYKIYSTSKNKAKKYLGENSTILTAIMNKKVTDANLRDESVRTKITNFLSTSESKYAQITTAKTVAATKLRNPIFTNIKVALFYAVMERCNPEVARLMKSGLDSNVGPFDMITYIKDNYDLYDEDAMNLGYLYNYVISTPCTSLSELNDYDDTLLSRLLVTSDINKSTEDNWMNNMFSGISRLIKMMLGITSDSDEVVNADGSLSSGYSSDISILGTSGNSTADSSNVSIMNNHYYTFEERFKALVKLLNADPVSAIFEFENSMSENSLYSLLNLYGIIDDYNRISGTDEHIVLLKTEYLKKYSTIIENFKKTLTNILDSESYANFEDLSEKRTPKHPYTPSELFKIQFHLYLCYGATNDLSGYVNGAAYGAAGPFDNKYFYNRMCNNQVLISSIRGKTRESVINHLSGYCEGGFERDLAKGKFFDKDETDKTDFTDSIYTLNNSNLYSNDANEKAWNTIEKFIRANNENPAMRTYIANSLKGSSFQNSSSLTSLNAVGAAAKNMTVTNPFKAANRTANANMTSIENDVYNNAVERMDSSVFRNYLKHLSLARFLYRTNRLSEFVTKRTTKGFLGMGKKTKYSWNQNHPKYDALMNGTYKIPSLSKAPRATTVDERRFMAENIGLPGDSTELNPDGRTGTAFGSLMYNNEMDKFYSFYNLWKSKPTNVGGPFEEGFKFNMNELLAARDIMYKHPSDENSRLFNAHILTAQEIVGDTQKNHITNDFISSYFGNGNTIDPTGEFNTSAMGSGFVSQFDYGNARFSDGTSLAEAGCGPAVASMALSNLSGGNSTMMAAAALADKYKDAGGTQASYFQDIFSRAGAQTEYFDNNIRGNVKNSLKNGEQVVLMGRDASNTSKANSPFGPNNHYVLATGLGNGKLMVSDPEQDSPSVYSESILNKTRLGVAVSGAGAGLPFIPMKDNTLRKITLSGGASNLSKHVAIAIDGTVGVNKASLVTTNSFKSNNATLVAIYAIAQVESSGKFNAVNPKDGVNSNPAISVGCMQWYHVRGYNLLNEIIERIGVTKVKDLFKSHGCENFFNQIRKVKNAKWDSKGIVASTDSQIAALKELLATNESKTVQLETLSKEVHNYMVNLKQYTDIKTRIALASLRWNRGNIKVATNNGVTESTDYKTTIDILERVSKNGRRWPKTLEILNSVGSVTMPSKAPTADEVARVFNTTISNIGTIFDYKSSSTSGTSSTSSGNWLDKLNDAIYNMGKKILGLEDDTTTSTDSESLARDISQSAKDFGEDVVELARTYVGKITYKYGGTDIDNGSGDCSAFTQHVFKLLGVNIPRTASYQATMTGNNVTRINSIDSLIPGALVFWKLSASTTDKLASHVGIYSGDGNVIHLGSSGCKEVKMFSKDKFIFGLAIDPPTWGEGADVSVDYNSKLASLSDYNSTDYMNNPSANVDKIWAKHSAAGSGIRRGNSKKNNAAIANAISAAGSKITSSNRLPSMNDVMSGGIKFGDSTQTSTSRRLSASGSRASINADYNNRPAVKSARRSGGASSVSTVDTNLLNTIITLLGNIADNTSNVKDIVTLLSSIVNSETASTTKSTAKKASPSKNLGSVLSKHASSDKTDVSALLADLKSIVSNA